jgi:DNA primase
LQAEKLRILEDILGENYSTGTEYLFHCPSCNHHKKKLSVNIDKNKFKCWICDYSGRTIRRLVRKHGDYKQLQKWNSLTGRIEIESFESIFEQKKEVEEKVRLYLPEDFVSLTGKNHSALASKPLNYLKSRGIDRDDILKWKIGYSLSGKYGGRILIPSFSDDGSLNYFVARSYMSSYSKYLNPPASKNIVFNHLYVDWDSDVVLVEGVFDAIRAGANAIPILGSSLNEDSVLFQEIIKNDATIYVALDPDAEKKSLKLMSKLLQYDIEVKKVNIFPYSDVAEMTREEFERRKAEAKPFTSDDFLYRQLISI